MARTEFLRCLFRASDGEIREAPFPGREPKRDALAGDLYCPWYEVRGGVLGSRSIVRVGILILNTPVYRPDPNLEEVARERLVRAILVREGTEAVQREGGLPVLRDRIRSETYWPEGDHEPRA